MRFQDGEYEAHNLLGYTAVFIIGCRAEFRWDGVAPAASEAWG
jgi:hypothetical protein